MRACMKLHTDAGAGLMLAIVAVSDYTITFVNTLSNTVTVSPWSASPVYVDVCVCVFARVCIYAFMQVCMA